MFLFFPSFCHRLKDSETERQIETGEIRPVLNTFNSLLIDIANDLEDGLENYHQQFDK